MTPLRVIWSTRRRWVPLKHAARLSDGGWTSLCGRLDETRHKRRCYAVPSRVVVGGVEMRQVNCVACMRRLST